MTFERVGEEVVKVTQRKRVKLKPVEDRSQYCMQKSDDRLREIIRGMDDRERMIVLEEIVNIYLLGEESAHV